MDNSVNIMIYYGNNEKKEKSLKLYGKDCLVDLDEMEIPTIKEYEKLSIELISDDAEVYFYIPELDDYYIKGRKKNNKTGHLTYLPNFLYQLYAPDYLNNKNEQYDEQEVPFVPGNYSIEVHHSGKIYYSYWRIIPKDLNDKDLNDMRIDVNDRVRGLAFDFISRMKVKNRTIKNSEVESFIDNDIDFLIKNKSKIIFSLENIKNDANYKITKNYAYTKSDKVSNFDQITIKNMLKNPNKGFYIPKRYLDYDTNENRWLKMFINKIIKSCKVNIHDLITYKSDETIKYNSIIRFRDKIKTSEREYNDKHYYEAMSKTDSFIYELKKLEHYLKAYTSNTFIKNIKVINNPFLSKTLMMSPSYNLLYKIYAQLYLNKDNYSLDPYYSKYWKKTTLLYEIWTYIKVLDSLIKLGFSPKNGWIYEKNSSNEIKFLNDNDHVELENEIFNINVTYNQLLPKYKSKVTRLMPLMSESNRRKPDIRIDIFNKNNFFLGSIILDAKYKNLPGIIRGNITGNPLRQQFIRYKDDFRSSLLKIKKIWADRVKAVDSVLVLYPNKKGSSETDSKYDDGIYYVNVKPNQLKDELTEKLKERFDRVEGTMNSDVFDLD